MADRVFCIDFGTAYTKVALRRDPVSKSALLACAVLSTGLKAADVSYLDPASWDGTRRVVLAAGRTAADRLSRDAGRALKALGVGVEVRNSDNSSERVRA